MTSTDSMKVTKWLWFPLVLLGLLRLASLGAYPLADTTEARYGNIARLMVETGDWITPQYSVGVPFWGKPPLSTWLSAGAMRLFGINEFASRFPSFLMALMVLALVWQLAARHKGRDYALVSILVLTTTAIFFVSSGTVMTDPALLAGTTLCMVAFWQALIGTGRYGRLWGYGFFIGLAIGLLAKGPIALVLTALPIGTWVILERRWSEVWQRLPWMRGLALTVVLSAPWYLLAEQKTPGFLDYFLIGEHWNRFTIPGWKGDLYGKAHLRPRGTIWIYGLACALPWSLIVPAWLLKKEFRTRALKFKSRGDGWMLYLILWAVAPMVFFTFSGNILPSYVLPGIPAIALVTADLMITGSKSRWDQETDLKVIVWGASFMSLLFAIALGWTTLGKGPAERSQKTMMNVYRDICTGTNSTIIYMFKRPYSAEFYSQGEALLADDLKKAEAYLQNQVVDYFAVRIKDMDRLPESFKNRITVVRQVNRYYLLVETAAPKAPHLGYDSSPPTQECERTGKTVILS